MDAGHFGFPAQPHLAQHQEAAGSTSGPPPHAMAWDLSQGSPLELGRGSLHLLSVCDGEHINLTGSQTHRYLVNHYMWYVCEGVSA